MLLPDILAASSPPLPEPQARSTSNLVQTSWLMLFQARVSLSIHLWLLLSRSPEAVREGSVVSHE